MVRNTKSTTNVAIWTRFELELTSVKLHDNPVLYFLCLNWTKNKSLSGCNHSN